MDRRDNVAIAMSAVLTMAVVVVVLRLLGLPDLPILLWQTLTDLSVLGAPRLVALALVGGIITICVDEVGHALAASLNGVALTGVAIGPVVISSTPGRGGFTVRPRLP